MPLTAATTHLRITLHTKESHHFMQQPNINSTTLNAF
jgi:hypothetical protein